MESLDLTRGIHRRIYSGASSGRRISRVSEGAEMWFWRLHMVCDDFGNFTADPDLCRAEAAPLRRMTGAKVGRYLDELEDAGLIDRYESGGEAYGHIIGFISLQPAGKNGRRIQRVPQYPDIESETQYCDIRGNPGESRGIQGQPNESTETETETEPDTETKTETITETETDADGSGSEGRPEGDFPGPVPSRIQARNRWLAEVAPLWRRNQEAKQRADKTSSERLFDDLIWPEDATNGMGPARLKKACAIVAKSTGARNRMAYITDMLRKEWK